MIYNISLQGYTIYYLFSHFFHINTIYFHIFKRKRIFMKLFKTALILFLSSSFLSAFSFNGWHSGMTLDQALEVYTLEHKSFENDTHTCNSTCRHIYFSEDIL